MLYRNFSNQDEIDREYNPRLRVEQTDQYLTKYLSESERVNKTCLLYTSDAADE